MGKETTSQRGFWEGETCKGGGVTNRIRSNLNSVSVVFPCRLICR
jgi:hypothetical protein